MSINGHYLGHTNFLDVDLNEELYQKTLALADTFETATVINYSDEYTDWRKAIVTNSWEIEKFSSVLKEKILLQFREICVFLHIDEFKISEIQVQLTAHNDGHYFKEHTDAGNDDLTKHRRITFVYYFHGLPKQFEGGEFVLLEKPAVSIEPFNNTIIFFNSLYRHEVRKVICPSKKFENSRFTLNGWITAPEN